MISQCAHWHATGAGYKRRLFLSARGWRSGHVLPSDTHMLALRHRSIATCMLSDDELPALLALSSHCKVLAFKKPEVGCSRVQCSILACAALVRLDWLCKVRWLPIPPSTAPAGDCGPARWRLC